MRLLSTIVASLALVLATHSAVAAGKGPSAGNAAGPKANGAISTQETVTFTLTPRECSSLPAGTVLVGSGELRSILNTHTSRGITRQTRTEQASGTATDQAGNTYVWVYANQLNETNTPPSLDWYGTMIDHFSLAGSGPAHINANFVADSYHDTGYTFLFLTPRSVVGDPLDFGPPLVGHCDPL
jgi:hypothetical protein